jgi:hypothetical protein
MLLAISLPDLLRECCLRSIPQKRKQKFASCETTPMLIMKKEPLWYRVPEFLALRSSCAYTAVLSSPAHANPN